MRSALGGLCLLLGFFFVFKTFTAPNIYGRNKRMQVTGEGAGKVDCGLMAIVMFYGAYVFLKPS